MVIDLAMWGGRRYRRTGQQMLVAQANRQAVDAAAMRRGLLVRRWRFLAFALAFWAFAASPSDALVIAATAPTAAAPGESFAVTLEAEDVVGMEAFTIDITYDSSLLAVSNVTEGDLISDTGLVGASGFDCFLGTADYCFDANDLVGTVATAFFVFDPADAISGDGSVLVADFTVLSSAPPGITSVAFLDVGSGFENELTFESPVSAVVEITSVAVGSSAAIWVAGLALIGFARGLRTCRRCR